MNRYNLAAGGFAVTLYILLSMLIPGAWEILLAPLIGYGTGKAAGRLESAAARRADEGREAERAAVQAAIESARHARRTARTTAVHGWEEQWRGAAAPSMGVDCRCHAGLCAIHDADCLGTDLERMARRHAAIVEALEVREKPYRHGYRYAGPDSVVTPSGQYVDLRDLHALTIAVEGERLHRGARAERRAREDAMREELRLQRVEAIHRGAQRMVPTGMEVASSPIMNTGGDTLTRISVGEHRYEIVRNWAGAVVRVTRTT